jgi:hypothetical protein
MKQGVSGMLKKLKSLQHNKDDKTSEQLNFYQSAIYAFEVKWMHACACNVDTETALFE